MKLSLSAMASVMAIMLAATPSPAFACGCCGGGEAAKAGKKSGGCMGSMGASQSPKQSSAGKGMSCMGGMASMDAKQKSSDDAMMEGMDHSKMDMPNPEDGKEGSPEPAAAISGAAQRPAVALAVEYLKTGSDAELKALAEAVVGSESKELEFLKKLVAAGGK